MERSQYNKKEDFMNTVKETRVNEWGVVTKAEQTKCHRLMRTCQSHSKRWSLTSFINTFLECSLELRGAESPLCQLIFLWPLKFAFMLLTYKAGSWHCCEAQRNLCMWNYLEKIQGEMIYGSVNHLIEVTKLKKERDFADHTQMFSSSPTPFFPNI